MTEIRISGKMSVRIEWAATPPRKTISAATT
jgi:hypothetical protein